MTLEKKISGIFGLKCDDWLKHANPISVWSRFPILFFLVISIWSRIWLGIWCLVPVGFLIIWAFLNPKFFKKPQSTKNWASKSVLGEQVWANRKQFPVPKHHQTPVIILSLLQFFGVIILGFGLFQLNLWQTIAGTITVYFAKMWFLDRMVWLFEDMKDHKEYRDLLY